jgi:hypothetical protein
MNRDVLFEEMDALRPLPIDAVMPAMAVAKLCCSTREHTDTRDTKNRLFQMINFESKPHDFLQNYGAPSFAEITRVMCRRVTNRPPLCTVPQVSVRAAMAPTESVAADMCVVTYETRVSGVLSPVPFVVYEVCSTKGKKK